MVLQRFLLARAFRLLGVRATEMAVFVQNFQFIPLITRIPSRRMIFDYIDDAFGFTYFPPYIRREWTEAVAHADAITTTSALLREQMVREGRHDTQVIRNGVDAGLFAVGPLSSPRPADLPAGEQIVVYTGSVYPWFDFDLLGYLLQVLPQYQFVLIGHEHPGVRMDLHRLGSHANFHVLGVRPYTSLPSYLAHASAGIIPFRKNTLTAAVNPVKLYEYSAAGIPTVTTDFATELTDLGVPLFISSSREQFALNLREAVARSGDEAFSEQLRAFARSNNWEQRAQAFAGIIDPR
jgi:glycosyltransferase involved in cell wall biosynthesis